MSILLHANIQYAEIPYNEWDNVFEKSYYPTINYLLSKEIKFGLNITSYTIERLPNKIIGLIRDGISSELIELTGCSYTHAILPLLPLDHVYMQIKKDREIKEEIFDVKPRVFWPPELAYDPLLPGILNLLGYDHVFVDGEALYYTSINDYFGKYRSPIRHLYMAEEGKWPVLINYLIGLYELKRFLKKIIGGKVTIAGIREIIGIPVWVPLNTATILGIGKFPFMSPRKLCKWFSELYGVMLYATDIEFFGYRRIANRLLDISKLVELLECLDTNIVFPSELPLNNEKMFLKTSSWAPDKGLGIWDYDWDNRRPNMFIGQISGERAFIVENSDVRGWRPLPEKKINAYRAIFKYWMEEKK